MDLMLKAIAQDWFVLLPIFICSFLVVAVAINRIIFYKKNERNINDFIPKTNNLAPTLVAIALFMTLQIIILAIVAIKMQRQE